MSIIHNVSAPHPSPTLRVVVDVEPPTMTVRLEGEIDLACAEVLRALTEIDLAGVTSVVCDLTDLDFTDTTGLRALIALRDLHLSEDREVTFLRPQPLVRRVFELVGYGDALAAA